MAMRYNNYTLLGWFPENKDGSNLINWMKSSVPEKFALYDLSTDPEQKNDLAVSQPEIINQLKPLMLEQWKDIRDEGPDWGKSK